ncbi:MAG TPA: heparan-alpha-glucosaminide N-acetyltransferase domain-containing protein [Bacteroidales bacterium]|nr:heparan-alpha-glucosaminide N-acetyltransferase domain-containing protein [Bacteroidales bacterium]
MSEPAVTWPRRAGTPDLLKGIAVILMIQVHLMEQMATPELYSGPVGRLSLFLGGPFCAPVFLAVMGFYLARPGKTTAYFFRRGAVLFLGGIVLNGGRSLHLLFLVATGRYQLDPLPYLLGADILSLAGLSLIFTGIFRKLFRSHPLPWIVLALTLPVAMAFLPQPRLPFGAMEYITAFLWSALPWSFFPVIPWYSYVLTGYIFRMLLDHHPLPPVRSFRYKYVPFIPVWAGLLITLPWAVPIAADLGTATGYYHHGFLFFSWTLLFLGSWTAVVHVAGSRSDRNPLTAFLRWAGQNVTVLYVIQWLIIGNLTPLLYRSTGLTMLSVWFFVVTILTALGGWIYNRFRLVISRK